MTISYNERIEIIEGEKEAMETLVNVMSRVLQNADVVGDLNAPSFSMGVNQIKGGYISFKKRGIRIRFITEIVPTNISYCKELMQYVELRHLNRVKGNMAISETEYVATAVLSEEAKPITQTIYSNIKTILEQNRYFFENLWSQSIPAKQKIRELEEGIESEFFDVIYDYQKIIIILNKIIGLSKGEIRVLLPIEEYLIILGNKGIVDKLLEFSKKNNTLKIITTKEEMNFNFNKLNKFENISILKGSELNHQLLIINDNTFLRMGFKSNSECNSNIEDLFELAVYSNNKKSVDLFKYMFDLLWNERKINDDLEKADRLQKHFIDIAAHELRTPIQTITGLTTLLQTKKTAIIGKQDEIINVISRNADRLQKITENLLYKTKIESHGLKLNKEQFDMSEKVSRVIEDIKSQTDAVNNVEIIIKRPGKPIIVNADKVRIYEVVANLLNNAIKFTTNGIVTISLYLDHESKTKSNVKIEIIDEGTGIDEEILPKLFTPFLTGSSFGLGLGLYICKYIVEAHGGKIWAFNNKNGKGATFAFSLPLTEK